MFRVVAMVTRKSRRVMPLTPECFAEQIPAVRTLPDIDCRIAVKK